MRLEATSHIDIRAIIAQGTVDTRFQPIPSIRRRALIGVEALCRTTGPDGTPIALDVLFRAAEQQGQVAELDYLCHRRAIERFLPLVAAQPDLVLFLNVAPGTFIGTHSGSASIGQLASTYGLDPHNIAIEIPEAEIADTDVLHQAVRSYNDAGFLVALDDVGVKHSNMDRIIALHPDILKVDRSLLHQIERDTYKQEIFKALVGLSERLGGWVIAEGIEQEAGALKALELGGDIVQGYYFGRPGPFEAAERRSTLERIDAIARSFKHQATHLYTIQRDAFTRRRSVAQSAARTMAAFDATSFDTAFVDVLSQFPNVQSACMLDLTGTQITDTVWRAQHTLPQKTVIFHPPTRGTNHSLKEYFFLLAQFTGGFYETTPYVPLPTSALCITVSCYVEDAEGITRVLCLHLDAETDHRPTYLESIRDQRSKDETDHQQLTKTQRPTATSDQRPATSDQ